MLSSAHILIWIFSESSMDIQCFDWKLCVPIFLANYGPAKYYLKQRQSAFFFF
jgi:hypothetical protein